MILVDEFRSWALAALDAGCRRLMVVGHRAPGVRDAVMGALGATTTWHGATQSFTHDATGATIWVFGDQPSEALRGVSVEAAFVDGVSPETVRNAMLAVRIGNRPDLSRFPVIAPEPPPPPASPEHRIQRLAAALHRVTPSRCGVLLCDTIGSWSAAVVVDEERHELGLGATREAAVADLTRTLEAKVAREQAKLQEVLG